MKTTVLLIAFLVMSFFSNAQIAANITGPDNVSPGEVVTYTSDIPPGFYIVWSVAYGSIVGSNFSYLVNNSNTVTIKWNTPSSCGTSLQGVLYTSKYSTWTPTGPASYSATKQVTILPYSCNPPPPPSYPCSVVGNSFESVWNNPSIPQGQKCGILTNIYNSYKNIAGFNDFSCLDWHGCPH